MRHRKMRNLLLTTAIVIALGLADNARASNIILVYDNGDPQPYVSFLQALYGDGARVLASQGRYQDGVIDQQREDELRDAGLVVVTRDANSAHYDTNAEFWNTLATPVLVHNAHFARAIRWNWLNEDLWVDDADGQFVSVPEDTKHELYNGVTIIDDRVQVYNSPTNVHVNRIGAAVGNGTRLAWVNTMNTPSGAYPVIVTWDTSGAYYAGSHAPGADRVLFSTEHTSEFFDATDGATDDGKQVLRNSLMSLYAGTTIAQYTFNESDFIIDTEQVVPHSVADHVTASNLTDDLADPGSNANVALAEISRSYPTAPALDARPAVAVSTEAEAIDSDVFFEFCVSADPGFALDLTRLTFDASRGSSSSERGWALHTSLDSFATTVDWSVVTDASSNGMESFVVDLTGDTFQYLEGDVVFRMYLYTGGSDKSIDFDNLTLLGHVVETPEPGTLALLATGLVGFFALRRRGVRVQAVRFKTSG